MIWVFTLALVVTGLFTFAPWRIMKGDVRRLRRALPVKAPDQRIRAGRRGVQRIVTAVLPLRLAAAAARRHKAST
jgi:hypothetical protein